MAVDVARGRFAGRMLFALLAALAFTLLYLQVSHHQGRLSRDLQYDDVQYALDAATRLDIAMEGGIPALLKNLVAEPAHSYLSLFQGMVAFAVGGEHDASLYASNAWILLAVAALLAAALRSRPAGVGAVSILFVLTAPIAYFAIGEFRPDVALGLATALMAYFFIDAGLRDDPRSVRRAGYLLAAALVIKSTFFAHTLAIAIGLAIAAGLATLAQRHAWMPRFALARRDVAVFLALGIGIALPFYALNAAHVAEYFWRNTAGDRAHIWNFDQALALGELYHRFEPLMFGLNRVQSLAGVAFAGVGAVLLWGRGDRSGAAQVAGLLAVALVSCTIIILGRQPSHFFFATAHWLAMMAAIFAFARLHDHLARRGRRALVAGGAAAVVALACLNSTFKDTPWPAGAERANSWNARLVELMRRDAQGERATPPPTPNVLVLSAAAVNSATLRWVSREAGFRLNVPDETFLADPDEAWRVAQGMDYVVVPNRAIAVEDAWLPVAKVQAPVLEHMSADPRFQLLGVPDSQQRFYVFANRAATVRFLPVPDVAGGGAVSLEGLRAEEGPYPAHHPPLPRLRWIEGKSAGLCARFASGEALELDLGYWSRTEGTLAVEGDGRELARATLHATEFGKLKARFPAGTGRTCIRLAIDAPDNEPPLYVLLTRLTLQPAK